MIQVLFFTKFTDGIGRIAESIALSKNIAGIKFLSAELIPSDFNPLIKESLSSLGVPSEKLKPRGLHELDGMEIDVAILIGSEIEKESVFLPGNPVTLVWNIEKPLGFSTQQGCNKAYSAVRDIIFTRIDDLINNGYLDAFAGMRNEEKLILENISDGIIAHDLSLIHI